LAILCPGFCEYEWTAGGDLVLTLFRSIGELSRNQLPSRPGHAAWPTPIPEAQEPGRHVIECAIAPLAAREAEDVEALEHLWEETQLPLQSFFAMDFVGDRSRLDSVGIALHGEGLVCTAVKPFGNGPGVVVRCYNSTAMQTTGRITTLKPLGRAALLRADETLLAELPAPADGVVFPVPAHGIATVVLA
jgi:alpha-mannosidase